MRSVQTSKQTPYRRNSYRQNSKPYYNGKEEQKSSYNYIEETKIRIVQDNLVSVTGLPVEYDDPDLLGDSLHFGKYGTVEKIIISSQGKHNKTAFIQVYITYSKSIDAAFAIRALDGIKIKGREITATFGTTKYCTYFLKNIECRNERCFYLHSYDTKNELMDGVKNNMDFLDEKSQKILNSNLKYYLQKLLDEEQQKQQVSQFPTIAETIEYLIEEKVLQQETVDRLKKQIIEEKKGCNGKGQQISIGKQRKDSIVQEKNHNNNNKGSPSKSISPSKNSSPNQQLVINSALSNMTNDDRDVSERLLQQDMISQNQVNPSSSVDNTKSKKCHSLSTTSSPQKYQKLTDPANQNIDKTIEKRIIKQIMRTNIIFRSRMEFVTKVTNNVKQENNKIKNYVRKYLLNQL